MTLTETASIQTNSIGSEVTLVEGYVPVVNLTRARTGDRESRIAVARAIGDACETSGFFAVMGHGVPSSTVAEMYRVTKQFFALSPETKMALLSDNNDPLMRGFGREGSLAASNDDASLSHERALPDVSETYTYNRLGEPDAPTLPAGADPKLKLPNKWPDLPGFARAYRAYYNEMEQLALEIMRLFALALRLPENWFDLKVDEHMTNLTANFYPPQLLPPHPGRLRKGQHSDWGSLTILYQDDAPGGLQVLDKNASWVDVPAIEGSFVVNIGDLMAVWTNDKWVSTVHRVVNPPRDRADTERYSVPFFHQPNFDAIIECIPTCTGPANPPRYVPVQSGEYIMEKFRRAYGK